MGCASHVIVHRNEDRFRWVILVEGYCITYSEASSLKLFHFLLASLVRPLPSSDFIHSFNPLTGCIFSSSSPLFRKWTPHIFYSKRWFFSKLPFGSLPWSPTVAFFFSLFGELEHLSWGQEGHRASHFSSSFRPERLNQDHRTRTIHLFLRDGLMYFLVIFMANLFNTLMFFVSVILYKDLETSVTHWIPL